MRHASKVDSSQAEIVQTLRENLYEVDIQGRPVDLRVRAGWWPWPIWFELECKTPHRKTKTMRKRIDQAEQADYCKRIGVPYVTTGEQALAEIKKFEMDMCLRRSA